MSQNAAANFGDPVDLHYRVEGEGPPILVLHGLFGSGTNWRSISRRLADRFSVYAVDLRNHGRSPHRPVMTYASMAEDVTRLLQTLGLKKTAIVGHSMGGKVAMTLALTNPSSVTRLCVADIAPAPSEGDHSPYLTAMLNLTLDELERRADADRLLAASISEPGLRAFLLQNLVSSAEGYHWRLNLDTIKQSMDDLTGFSPPDPTHAFPGPTLFLRGERSSYVRDEHIPIIRSLFPNAAVTTIANAGHWLHAEQPEAFLHQLTPFLS